MMTNPDATAGPSIELTEGLLKGLGIVCIWIDRIAGEERAVRLAIRTIVGRRAVGQKIWFRNRQEADKVERAVMSRCQHASRTRDGLSVELPADQVFETVTTISKSLGINPISDRHVALTFDSINARIQAALVRFNTDGTMKRLNREYADLRAGGNKGTLPGDISGTKGQSILPYRKWLIERLSAELLRSADLQHLTRL